MLMFMLTVTGALSLVIIVRSVLVMENRSFIEGLLHLFFGVFSFITTAFLSNQVQL